MKKLYPLFINGEWRESDSLKEIISPYDGQVVGQVFFAQPVQVKEAIDAAFKAFDQARKMPSYERARILEEIAVGLKKRREEIARSIALQAGKPIRDSRTEVARATMTFDLASEEAKRIGGEIIPLDLNAFSVNRWGLIRRFPLGPISAITPFNFPLNLVAHKVAPALASGNTLLLRPASQVPITSLLLAEIVAETGLPAGIFNVIPCDYRAAESLLTDDKIKKITFTGSSSVGWEIKAKAPKKRVTLELGGNAALVVEPDADLDFAVTRAVTGAFSYAGQICISIQRLFLHKKIYDRFMADFLAKTKALRVGDPLDESTDVGPMINEGAARQIEEWVLEAAEKGARILCGGRRQGAIFEPTILENVKPEWRISWLEAFAPIVVVYAYDDFDKVLDEVNYSIYGLQAGIFTRDLNKAWRAFEALEVGGVIINDIPTYRIDHMPYGGVKESGTGREGIRYAIEEMTELKLLVLNLK
ncbi:MAG: aldehyde dehydrogenase family protein [Candidatus Aminicenantes bacterium]|nr:aldehyde dehydrogenase family protein [Candidatus Aminicenantes bacterium]